MWPLGPKVKVTGDAPALVLVPVSHPGLVPGEVAILLQISQCAGFLKYGYPRNPPF